MQLKFNYGGKQLKLKNKVALVTGATSGIGLEIATLFAREGAKVVIASRHIDDGKKVAQKIKDQGGHALAISLDVSDEDQVNAGVKTAVNTFGNIDILVSNAGGQHIEAVDKLDFGIWRRMLAVHLDGAFLTSKACLKSMYKSGKGGSIIFMGSVHSKWASKLKAPYVTAKHGLLGLCRVIAKEGAEHGVRCNVICPGFVHTPLVDKQIPEQAKKLHISQDDVVKKVMLGETVDSEFTSLSDIAQVALIFANFKTNALTGQSLIASHGWFME
jgi:3-hydroxybutyrate dehydrogenase